MLSWMPLNELEEFCLERTGLSLYVTGCLAVV
jgi:hypothetical protein